MTIRTANINDLEKLTVIFEKYRAFYGKEANYEAAKSFLKEKFEKDESVVYIAEENSEIVGFTQLYPLFSSTRLKRLWLLNDLYVEQEHRKKGISVALIEKAQQLCRDTDACQLSLETSKTNAVGNQLYPKTGFELDTTENFYYWTPQ